MVRNVQLADDGLNKSRSFRRVTTLDRVSNVQGNAIDQQNNAHVSNQTATDSQSQGAVGGTPMSSNQSGSQSRFVASSICASSILFSAVCECKMKKIIIS